MRVGVADAREGARWFYTDMIDAPRLGLHAVERVQRVARALGADATEPRFNLPITRARSSVGRQTSWRECRLRGSCSTWERAGTRNAGRPNISPKSAGVRSHEFGAGLIAVGSAGDRPLVDQTLAENQAGFGPRSLRTDSAPGAGGPGRGG